MLMLCYCLGYCFYHRYFLRYYSCFDCSGFKRPNCGISFLFLVKTGHCIVKNPFKRNSPTDPSFVMTGHEKDFEKEKQSMIAMINDFKEENIKNEIGILSLANSQNSEME